MRVKQSWILNVSVSLDAVQHVLVVYPCFVLFCKHCAQNRQCDNENENETETGALGVASLKARLPVKDQRTRSD